MREGSSENRTGGESPLRLFPAPVLTGITVACVLLFVVGVLGNLMTMLVVSRFRDMRTTTNFYLSSMAFSDLLIFLCMPLDLFRLWQYRPWNFGDLLCKLFQFISESCTYSTILNITALSVERYVAICFPLRAKVIITKRKVKLVILILWAVSFISAGPIFVLVGVEHENGTNPLSTNECRATEYAIRSGLLTIMVWISSIFFFLPVFCLTVLYSLIGRKLWRRKRKNIGPSTIIRDKNNKQTVKMLVNTLSSAVFCFSRGGICFHTLLVAFSRRTIFIFQILRSRILGDSSDQPVLQLGVLCPLLPERSHQPHPLQHHVQEVPRCRMPALRTQSPAKEKTLQHQAGQLTCMDRTHRRHMTWGPVPEHHTPVLPESHHGGDVGQGTNRQGKLYLCRHLDLLGDVT
uniref:Growth hormone secretagogue receptor type 1 n=1 Tax=Gallus gallus TaxID=9031 RepID=A0A8V0Z6L9_CHICK